MTERHCRHIRLAFEPNRLAAEQLVKVYEGLKPLESRTTAAPTAHPPAGGKRFAAKRGGQ